MRRNNFKYRDEQLDLINKAYNFIVNERLVYISAEVRTGKTLMSLEIAKRLCVCKNDRVLFVTTKKTLESNTILNDYKLAGHQFKLDVINHDSVHKMNDKYNVVIVDEAHLVGGSFPKPSNRYKILKDKIDKYTFVILLSGTPSPESKSQLFHQFQLSYNSPFADYTTFYKWAKNFVNIKDKYVGTGQKVNDYSEVKEEILNEIINPYFFSITQKESGFNTSVNETIHFVEISKSTYSLIDMLKRDLVIQGKDEVILADTGVKLQTKIHQLCSGTIKFESGNSRLLDLSKAIYINENFKDKKIAIFYKFKEELNALMNVFEDKLTTDLQEFYDTDKTIALQIRSGARGISLKQASDLVYYNIDFSAELYWQSRDRLTTKEREVNNIHWIFAKRGIENLIYKRVMNKKDFTLYYFKKDYLNE